MKTAEEWLDGAGRLDKWKFDSLIRCIQRDALFSAAEMCAAVRIDDSIAPPDKITEAISRIQRSCP